MSRAIWGLGFAYFVAVAFAATYVAIRSYGSWPDEMWGYPQSVTLFQGGRLSESIVTFPFFGNNLPYLTGPYQGAFKSYLFWLFLILTDGNGEQHRYLNFVLFLAVGLSMAWAVRPIAGGWLSIIPLLIAISDPNNVSFMPSDMGPFLLQNLFSVLSFGFLLRAALTGNASNLICALFFASAIVGDKLTGIPIAAGLGVAALFILLRHWSAMFSLRFVVSSTLALIAPVTPFLVFFARGGLSETLGVIGTPDTLAERIGRAADELASILSGSYSFVLLMVHRVAVQFGIPHYFFAVALLALVLGSMMILDRRARPIAACIALALGSVIFAIAFASFVLVPNLGRPWNYLVFNPILYLTMATIVIGALKAVSGRRVMVATIVLLLGVNFAAAQRNVVGEIFFQSKTPGRDLSSPATRPLVEILQRLGVKRVVCLDYGPCPAIYVLTAGRIAMVDWPFVDNFDNAPLSQMVGNVNTALLLRDITGITDAAWEARLQRGTHWFRERMPFGNAATLPLGAFDDTQFTLVFLAPTIPPKR